MLVSYFSVKFCLVKAILPGNQRSNVKVGNSLTKDSTERLDEISK